MDGSRREKGETKARSEREASRPARERLDVILVERGLAPSRERARALIMARRVLVDGRPVEKSGTMIPIHAVCELLAKPDELRYASRGGLKLERALDVFSLDPFGRICLDVGASTGGFTDVLLQRGARRVYAVDVGRGQLAWELRIDPRVVVMDRTNIRNLTSLPESPTCAVIDVSFISLRLVLAPVAALLSPLGWVVCLLKPQFEAGRREASRGGGVIRDPAVHRRVLAETLSFIEQQRLLAAGGLAVSPIAGRDGNHEYLLWLMKQGAHGVPGSDLPANFRQPGLAEMSAAVDEAFGYSG